MCYILKLFYLCASSTNKQRTEESKQQAANLDATAAANSSSLAAKEAEAGAASKKLDNNLVVISEFSICAANEEDNAKQQQLEFNENEIYEIEAANKALLAKKSKNKNKKDSSSSSKKKSNNNSKAAAVSSSSASCSSSSVVEAEKKRTCTAKASVVASSQQLPAREDSSSYSLYEYVRGDSKAGKQQLRKKTNTLEEFTGGGGDGAEEEEEENYFTHPNDNESILVATEAASVRNTKSSYLDFLQLGSYARSNAFDYSSLDRFSMTEMDPNGQQQQAAVAALRSHQAANDKNDHSASTTDRQQDVASHTDTNSLNSEASSSSLSNDPRQFLQSNNQKTATPLNPPPHPTTTNAETSLFDHLKKSFNSLNLSEDQRKFINPNEHDLMSRSGAAKSKLELFQNKAKFNVSIDNSNLYNNSNHQPSTARLANASASAACAADPNESSTTNRIMSTSTELINNMATFSGRLPPANNNSSNTRLNLGAAGQGAGGLSLLGEMNTSKNFSSSLSMFNGGGQAPRLRPSLMGEGCNLSTSKLDDREATSPKSPIQIKLQQPELKLDQLKKKKQGFYFETNNLLAMPNDGESSTMTMMPGDKELSLMLDGELSNSNLNEGDEDISSSASSLHPNSRSKPSSRYSDIEKHHRHHNSKLDYNKLQKGGKITITANQVYEFKESDLEDLGQIGHGEFGSVHKVLHKPSNTHMALKRIGPTVGNQGERKKVLKELDFVLECHEYEYVVRFYGVKFNNEPADCMICMELMDTSLEKFYKFVYEKKNEEIPETILGKIVIATVNALNYLKEQHKIIHRDVKPSNILVNRSGMIKMCDFGISGKLVDSIAASRDAGCQLYMAPERIDPERACTHGYDVRSDVWSLGITLYELATGKFPYPQWKTIFHQLNLVVGSDAPRLESERLSKQFRNFVNTCLTKDEKRRPKYKTLLEHELLAIHSASVVNVAEYVGPYINEMYAAKLIR